MSLMSMLAFPAANLFGQPKFSSNRHRPHSRLNDWHTVDYDEEILMDLSYCDKTFTNSSILNVAIGSDIIEDFSSLRDRSCSTSTPFVRRNTVSSSSNSEVKKNIFEIKCRKDFLVDREVLSTFVSSCKISSPAGRDSGHEKCSQSELSSDCAIFNSPLPCVSLEFDNIQSSDDEDIIDINSKNRRLQNNETATNTSNLKPITSESYQPSFSYCSLSSQTSSIDSGYDSQPITTSCLSNYEDSCEQSVENCKPNELQDLDSAYAIVQSIENCKQNKLQDFECASSKIDSSLLSKVIAHFSPKSPSVLIGKKIGVESIDIVSALHERNIIPALEKIFYFLNDSDLYTLCNVSENIKSIIINDPCYRQRRLNYIKSKKPAPKNKENAPKSPKKQDRGLTSTKDGPLTCLQQTAVPSKPSYKLASSQTLRVGPVTRYQVFVQEASKLKNDESLRKCPLCSSPAKTHTVQERACCTNQRCAYDFCIKCRNPFHGAKECTSAINKKTKTESSVGTRKSKKNLRRL